MNVYTDLNNLPKFKNAAITIGSFDGVHHGHQRIIERVNQLAHQNDGESILITFHPHPRQVIYPKDKSLKLLTTIKEKTALMERFGIDNLVIVPFTVEFSQQSPDEYIEKFLVQKFSPKFIVIGYDHRFGLNRQGDVNFLKWYGPKNDYEVVEIEPQEVDDIAVSSTKIRTALENGNVQSANALLNHNFTLSGNVEQGQRIGHTIGFPTANLAIQDSYKLVPPNGIYAAYVFHNNEKHRAMLYIGNRPTLPDLPERTIEVNIFNFNKDIYGQHLKVELVEYIREDAKLDGLDALKNQLAVDKQKVLSVLKKKEANLTKVESSNSTHTETAIVVLNYNGKAFLQKFLANILKNKSTQHRFFLADNGSTDDSLTFVKQNFPSVEIIPLKENTGFAQGYNLALEKVTAKYYILLNSDIETTPNWIQPIIELMENDQSIGACQPKILDYNKKNFFEYAGASGGWMDFLGYPFCRGRIFNINEEDKSQYNDVQEIFWATGAAMVVRAELFKKLGGFDGDYFAHSEEIDLCWRMKRAGYKIMVEPKSQVYHVGGGTLNYQSTRKTYLNFRNSLFTIIKNEPGKKLLWLVPVRLLLDGIAGGLFLVQGKFGHIGSILKAHFSLYGSVFKIWNKRKHYNTLLQKVKIAAIPNFKGIYYRSIVWDFYIRGKRYFSELKIDN